MELLQSIYGIGPVLAKTLIKKLIAIGYDKERFKYNSKNPYEKQQIYDMLKTPNIYDTLPESAKVYLQYLPDRGIPRIIIKTLEDVLLKNIKGLKLIIAGSYRRNRSHSNDADIVVLNKPNTIATIVNGVSKSKKVKLLKIYAEGPDKASVLFEVKTPKHTTDISKSKYVVKSDIFMAHPNEYMFTLLYATGSGGFNIIMRAQAKRNGLLLNQRGLYKNGELIPVRNEKEIFEILKMTYREPKQRDISLAKR